MNNNDINYVKSIYDNNVQVGTSLSRTKARLLFDGVSYQIFEILLDAHIQLNEHNSSIDQYVYFDDFFQIICIYGFLPLSFIVKCIIIIKNIYL